MLRSTSLNYQCAYYGIAHTPLVFRVGFKYGNGNDVILFHRKRERGACFEDLTHERNSHNIACSELHKSVTSNELLVSISTTVEISKPNLEILDSNLRHIIMFNSDPKGYDVIQSYETAEYFCNFIAKEVSTLVVKYNIKSIHMVISSSVAFTFLLGQIFNNNQFPDIIVYHFEAGEYQWGINMRKPPHKAFVPTKACNR